MIENDYLHNHKEFHQPSDSSPASYDNKTHVSEIYKNNVELAPSDNPTTSTYFASILREYTRKNPPKEQFERSFKFHPGSGDYAPDASSSKTISSTAKNTVSTQQQSRPVNLKAISSTFSTNSQQQPYRLQAQTSSVSGSYKTTSTSTSNYDTPSATIFSKHSNSCSTIYVDDSTVSQPNWKAMIKCVSLAIHSHIYSRKGNKTMEIFDEKLHPLTVRRRDPVPDDYDELVPEHKVIYRFLRILFTAAQLTAECAIVTLVYLERVLSYGELDLCPANWKRLVLGAVMLASKVWDDQAVWNVDFCQILKDITVHEMNELEREYVQLLQFNVNVGSSIYAKYYFDLRQLAKESKISFPDELLTKEKAIKLEAASMIGNRLNHTSANVSGSGSTNNNSGSGTGGQLSVLRRSASVEFMHSPRKSLLIIS
ncbi:unnamed protein product [Didymodactylos carnosus]|uniref:Cyclin-like domain-containing protein n=1 Tax=Didymodactylos carnosus TaxID=1234261 RepID=A0A813NI05_9BILA|nr:unnamed protein product [Didymodactylos carnosus]CAF0784284.1 unnamed protein product [Didymodactylos carnosus]CAF3518308.1 unnamed protein product [Didymodactylos carnosus]CAF3566334.1 unnamed protein product [Didymodactylos carnosus]